MNKFETRRPAHSGIVSAFQMREETLKNIILKKKYLKNVQNGINFF